MAALVYTIILNFNRWDNTIDCLRSLEKNDYPNHQIVVLNLTKDNYIPGDIVNEFPNVEIISIATNMGFAGNNNQGIRHAISKGAEWIFILNDDTLLASDCVSNLLEAAELDPTTGVVGPLIYHADEPDIIQSAGGYLDQNWQPHHIGMNEDDHGQFSSLRQSDWVNGCGFLCRTETLAQIGFLDERFFLYNEEVELCYRAKKNGWKIIVNPKAKLWHKGVSRDYHPSANVTYYVVRNFFLFIYKHKAPFQVKTTAWLDRLRMVASYSIRPKWRNRRDHRDAAVQGMRDFLFHRWGKRG